MNIAKKFFVYVLLGIMLIAINYIAPTQKAKAAGCSIVLTGAINGSKIDFSWTVSGYTPKAGDFYSFMPGVDGNLSPTLTSMSVTKPSAQTTYYVDILSSTGSVGCGSNKIVFTPPDGLTGGSGGKNDCGTAPSLTIKSSTTGTDATVELGWANQGTSTITTNSAKVYRDNAEFDTVDIRTDKYFYLKDVFTKTESHSYRVTQLFPSSTDPSGWCETPKSNEVKYNGTTETVEGALDKATSDKIFADVTPPSAGECVDKCHVGWAASHFTITGAVSNAICDMQCAIIDGISRVLTWVINGVLFPALGIKS